MSRAKVWVVDTSVLVEILDVPAMASNHKRYFDEFYERIKKGGSFELPVSVIIETGNHLGQNGDAVMRKKATERFCHFIKVALSNQRPWRVPQLPNADTLRQWIDAFPTHVEQSDDKGKGCGLGDLTIVQTVTLLRRALDKTDVEVWTLDQHLATLCASK